MERPVDSAVDRSPIIDRVTPRLSLSTYSGNRSRLGVNAGGASLPPGGRSNRSSGITGPASQAAALPAVKWRAAPPRPARRGPPPLPPLREAPPATPPGPPPQPPGCLGQQR